ncbi:MAG: nitrite/sulfite reductase [Gammaproteobacteria bacterium]|nr:nitrite/sulfite reductase [Gammaproteobacteria bacterium]
MYQYNAIDQAIVDQRVAQFRDQTRRFLAGEISDDEFKQLRLRNGLYIQRHAPMLRVAIPYGLLSATQLRKLAHIAREYDKGYGHFTTRQNIQYNWPALERVPDILAELATVQMHAIQTSGNCIRNTTCDHLAGVAAEELADPRAYCELIRQWSTLHPEFNYLPRKFKIAVTGSPRDRAASQVHDIGLHLVRDAAGELGYEVFVGGGLGRTPIIGAKIREFLPEAELLSYLEAILRVYNLLGRRDNLYKARIKILVKELGIEAFRDKVEAEWQVLRQDPRLRLDAEKIAAVKACFAPPAYEAWDLYDNGFLEKQKTDRAFSRWVRQNTVPHKIAGYRAVFLSLKAPGIAPGDITAEQMELVAELADAYSFGEIRSTHDQNLLLADVRQAELHALWLRLKAADLATANIGTLTDMICCPGLDFCALANASSIDVSQQIQARFEDLDYLYDLGDIQLNMSGCMNACGHHHVGNIGILGVDKNGEQFYQLTLGGSSTEDASLGTIIGPSVAKSEVADTLARILEHYVENRDEGESFLQFVRRVGAKSFKEVAYAAAH